MRVCSKCKISKSTNFFNKSARYCKTCVKEYDKERVLNNPEYQKNRTREWYQKNKECKKQYNKKYYESNKESVKESVSLWQRSNPELKKSYAISRKNKKRMSIPREGNSGHVALARKIFKKCLCCGSREDLTIDHIVPLTLGGPDQFSNYQSLCRSCNSKKHTKIIDYRILPW